MIITCLSCGTKNRVDESRSAQGIFKCGKCRLRLAVESARVASGPLTVTDANFASLVLNGGSVPVLLDCWATWCPRAGRSRR